MKPTYKMWTSGQLKMYKSTQHLQALVLLQNQENSKIKRKEKRTIIISSYYTSVPVIHILKLFPNSKEIKGLYEN